MTCKQCGLEMEKKSKWSRIVGEVAGYLHHAYAELHHLGPAIKREDYADRGDLIDVAGIQQDLRKVQTKLTRLDSSVRLKERHHRSGIGREHWR